MPQHVLSNSTTWFLNGDAYLSAGRRMPMLRIVCLDGILQLGLKLQHCIMSTFSFMSMTCEPKQHAIGAPTSLDARARFLRETPCRLPDAATLNSMAMYD